MMNRSITIAALLLMLAQSAVALPRMLFAKNDTVKTDTVKVDTLKTDSVEVDKVVKKKHECCEDTTVKDHSKPYHKLVKKGGTCLEGMFRVRHIEKKWYWEIPDQLLGRLMLSVSRLVNVPQGFDKLPGEEVSHNSVYFEQRDSSTMLLRSYARTQVADPDDDISALVDRSTVDPIVMMFNIIGDNPDNGDHLIEVTPLLTGDNAVAGFNSSAKSASGIGGQKNDRCFVDTVMAFPTNIEISTLRTYGASGRLSNTPAGSTGDVTLSMNTSLVLLPEEPMKPRLEDERVGYFVNNITKFEDEAQSSHHAIVSRYRLEPKDPVAYAAGKLVEPKKQIVYYIDPATPKKWIPYLKQGVDDWNVAFENAGFKNAIVAKEVPADGSVSPDDARYSFIRYLPSETENAYGPRIVDPRSGEIIEAHVCWYHNVMNLVRKWYIVQCAPLDKRAQKMKLDDKLMGQLIRFVSSHEVGHTLGLRHNMISSSFTPVEKLRDKAWVEKNGHTVSIMDYARFNYVAQPEDKVGEKGLFPRIGDYDKWAIKWGYQYRPEFKNPYDEKKALRSQVSAMLKAHPNMSYVGDEGRGQDPRSQTESVGDNNMKASTYGIKNLQRVMQNLEQWTQQPDGQYDDLSEMHRAVRQQFQRYVGHVQRNILGRLHNTVPGMKPYDFVPKAQQKEAIQWVGDNVMEPALWLFPQSIEDKLGVNAEDELLSIARTGVSYLLSPNLLANQYRDGVYPLEEYLSDVFATVWKPLNNKEEKRNIFRRQLQRYYILSLDRVLNNVTMTSTSSTPTMTVSRTTGGPDTPAANSDAVLYVEQHLDKVESYLKQQPQDGSLNALHYKNLLLRIKKIREQYESGKK
jgi:hypothetical protein